MRGNFAQYNDCVSYCNKQEVNRRSRKLPFEDIYWRLINHLRQKGYNADYDPHYTEHCKCLRKDHYKATKDNVWLFISKYPAGFKIKIDIEQNNMVSSSAFWGSYDDRYTKPTYLENKKIQLSIKHIVDFLSTVDDIEQRETEPKDPIKKLWYKEKENSHIHKGASSFEELKHYCDNIKMLSDKDRNGNILKCGDVKYFYSWKHGYRLCRCEVWHNINNMWWALVNGELSNNASWEYFDYNKDLPKKDTGKAISKVKQLIGKHSKEMNFEKCIALRNHLKELENNK